MVYKVVRQYLKDTTAHGFKYVGQAESWSQGAAWAVLIAASFAVSASLVASNLREASDNPFVTSISSVPVQGCKHFDNLLSYW